MSTLTQEIDSTDRIILSELLKNSNRSYRRLAKDLNLSASSVMDRIRKLEEKKVILGYGARLDYSKLNYDFMGLLEVNILGADLLKVEKQISSFEGVAAIWDTTGRYDAMVVLMCKNRVQLSSLIKKILAVPGVQKTNTHIVLNVVKRLTEFDGV